MARKNVKTIDNNAAYSIVNAAYKQAVGASAVDTLDLSDFCDSGVAYESLTMGRDMFYRALLDQVVNFYSDESYASEFVDPFFVESRRYAAVLQMITSIANDVEPNAAFRDFTPNTGTTPPTYATVGTYQVKPNAVNTRFFQKSESWQLPLWISEIQEKDAFRSDGDLRQFIDYLYVTTENKLAAHRQQLSRANVASLIGHKIHAHNEGVPGIHKVNLLTAYNKDRGKNITTVAGFMSDPDALRYASAQIILYSQYMREQTSLFNTEGLVKFCPTNRLVLEMNSAFENAINEVALSTTFHDTYLDLNGYSIPVWQGFGVDDAVAETSAASFDQVTKIDVTLDITDSNTNVSVNQSGVVALLADQYSALHTIRQEEAVSQRFNIEHLLFMAYQNRDSFCNNLGQNAIVFTVEAPSSPGPVSRIATPAGEKSGIKVLSKSGRD